MSELGSGQLFLIPVQAKPRVDALIEYSAWLLISFEEERPCPGLSRRSGCGHPCRATTDD